jgi:hypothetical protein
VANSQRDELNNILSTACHMDFLGMSFSITISLVTFWTNGAFVGSFFRVYRHVSKEDKNNTDTVQARISLKRPCDKWNMCALDPRDRLWALMMNADQGGMEHKE